MGREILLQAKEAAEEMGFTVLHMYVDGIWVKKEGLQEQSKISNPCWSRSMSALGCRLRWMASSAGFPSCLPSWTRAISVANRYFGVFQDGSTKERGIELRRHDTPAFIAKAQRELLKILAHAQDGRDLPFYLPEIRALLDEKVERIAAWASPSGRPYRPPALEPRTGRISHAFVCSACCHAAEGDWQELATWAIGSFDLSAR